MDGTCRMHEGEWGSIYVYIVWLGKTEGTVSLGITRHKLGWY